MLNGLLALVFGSFLSLAALRALVAEAGELRRVRALRSRGEIATATIVSLADLDPECGTREAAVRYEAAPGREVLGTAHLPWKGRPELVTGAQVQIRYDPETPGDVAPEAGRRQGRAEIRQAVFVIALMLVLVLPTALYLVFAGLHTLLF